MHRSGLATPRSLRSLASIVFALGLAGCVLFVPNESPSTTCPFTGAASACGACVRERCQNPVNDACGSGLDLLERCASNSDLSCDELAKSNTPLAACVTRWCAGHCQPLTGRSDSSCKDLPLGPGVGCTCLAGGEPNDFFCTKAVFPSAVCCATKGWPGAGLSCSCRRPECNPTADGCFCSLVDFIPDQEECSGLFCCVDEKRNDQCTCRARECYATERRVPSCGAAVMGCGPQDRVEACSKRIP